MPDYPKLFSFAFKVIPQELNFMLFIAALQICTSGAQRMIGCDREET